MSPEARAKAKQIQRPPPPNAPHSVAVPNSERPDRSAVYRHWRFKDELLASLDRNVSISFLARPKVDKLTCSISPGSYGT